MQVSIEEQKSNIIRLLSDNWVLGKSPISGRFWMQKDGLGSGGISIGVSIEAVLYLNERDIIKVAQDIAGKPIVYVIA
jgi:hypothetical protein